MIRTFLARAALAWAVLWGREIAAPTAPVNPTTDRNIIMALAEDILALFPAFQAATAAKDTEIANLTQQVSDLTKQVADAEAAVATVKGEINPPAPAPVDAVPAA